MLATCVICKANKQCSQHMSKQWVCADCIRTLGELVTANQVALGSVLGDEPLVTPAERRMAMGRIEERRKQEIAGYNPNQRSGTDRRASHAHS